MMRPASRGRSPHDTGGGGPVMIYNNTIGVMVTLNNAWDYQTSGLHQNPIHSKNIF